MAEKCTENPQIKKMGLKSKAGKDDELKEKCSVVEEDEDVSNSNDISHFKSNMPLF